MLRVENEIWKDIFGYQGLYQISNLGNVKTLKKEVVASNGSIRRFPEKIMNPNYINGYRSVCLYIKNNEKRYLVHRLVANAFIDNIFNKEYINHINGVRGDNRVENLEWVTPKENSRHALEVLGRGRYGSSFGYNKRNEHKKNLDTIFDDYKKRATNELIEPNDVEIWKNVVGYEGLYMVSNFGNVKSLTRIIKTKQYTQNIHGRMLNPSNSKGYKMVSVSDYYHKRNGFGVHVLVAEAFIPNPNNKECVNHIDGVRSNNLLSNLEWVTRTENTLHAFRVLGKNKPGPRKAVHQIGKDGNIICTYTSAIEAAKYTKANSGKISDVAHGRRKGTGGFSWAFVNTDSK